MEFALKFDRVTTYCYLSDCLRYVISISYTDKGKSTQRKWFSPWFGAPVTEWGWDLTMGKVPRTGHMKLLAGPLPDIEAARVKCWYHAHSVTPPDGTNPPALPPTDPAGNTVPASARMPGGSPE